jgi:PAS domain S-box-containing protein
MLVILILAISALLQFSAAFIAFRLIKVTQKTYSWILISAALCLMSVRRIIPIYYFFYMPESYAPDILNETIGLILSVFMLLGVISVRSLLTGRKEAEERYQNLLDNMMEGYQVIGKDWRYVYINDAVAGHGKTIKQKLIGHTMMEVYPGIENTKVFAAIKECIEKQSPCHMENEFIYPDGAKGWFDLSIQPVPDGTSILSIDISERKRAEMEIVKTNRLYAVISQINQMVIRARSLDYLFTETCRITTEHGKFRMAWIGLIDETNNVNPVACDGFEEGYLTNIKKNSISFSPEGRGPTGTAIREGKYSYCNNIADDPRMAPWRDEALKRGYLSSISLPIILKDKVIGTFNIYASEPYFFNESEIKLLEEVTCDIAFAIEMIDIENKRKHAEDELLKHREHLEDLVRERTLELEKINTNMQTEMTERKRMEEEMTRGRNMLRTLIDTMPDEIYAKDSENRYIMANSSVISSFGFTEFNDIISKTDFDLMSHNEAIASYSEENTVLRARGQIVNFEKPVTDPDGNIHWYAITKVPMRDKDGQITGLVGIKREKTCKKQKKQLKLPIGPRARFYPACHMR